MSSTALPFTSWPMPRKLAAGLFVAALALTLLGATTYLAGALFLALNKVDPRRAGFWSIARYWGAYADDPALRKKLVASIAVPATGLLVVLPIALVAAMRPAARYTVTRASRTRPRSPTPACCSTPPRAAPRASWSGATAAASSRCPASCR